MNDDKKIIEKLRALKEFESVVKKQRKTGRFNENNLKVMLKEKNIKLGDTLGIDLSSNSIDTRKKIFKKTEKKFTGKNHKKKFLQEKVKNLKKSKFGDMSNKNNQNGFKKVGNSELSIPLARGLNDLQSQIKEVGENILKTILIKNLKNLRNKNLTFELFKQIKENFSLKTSEDCQKFLFEEVIFDENKMNESTIRIDIGVQTEIIEKKNKDKFECDLFDGGETCDDFGELDLGFVDEDKLRESERVFNSIPVDLVDLER